MYRGIGPIFSSKENAVSECITYRITISLLRSDTHEGELNYLKGKKHPKYKMAAYISRCLRLSDVVLSDWTRPINELNACHRYP